MNIYDNGIVDNYGILKDVRDILGAELYDKMISVWGSDDKAEYLELASEADATEHPPDDISDDFAEALYATRREKASFMRDDLFGIFVGLVPLSIIPDDCYLPRFFLFRCSNNGRSVLVSDQEL
jgi:hypothetical protein